MKVATLRRVDAWLGLPACAGLTLLRRLARVSRWPARAASRRILFLKLAEQGSTVLAHDALRAAVERVGRENVYFAVFEQNRPILDALELVPRENVIAIRARSIPGALLAVLRAVLRMRRLRFDAAIDLEFFARSTAILAFLSGARRRVGLHSWSGEGPWRGDLLTHRLSYNPHVHTAQLFRLEVDALDLEPERFPAADLRPVELAALSRGRLSPSREALEQVSVIVREATALAELPPLVLLNANCSDLLPVRRWEDERYLELARRLLDEDPELWIAFTGAPDEAPAVEALARRVGRSRVVSLAGRTTLAELLVLYELAEILVTNDSGPAHFASLTTIDVVALFGPETPELFSGLSARSHVAWARTACSPCVNAYNNRVTRCTDNVCMQRIEVGEIHAKVRALREERGARALLQPARGAEAAGAPRPSELPLAPRGPR